jgi:predicted AAA+ superfamily ATPase
MEKDIAEGMRYFPVVAILGPRQSGKTTLAKNMFPNHLYVTLEDIDMREAAKHDPRSFLSLHRNEHGLIIDEFQHVPELLSYIQGIVDAEQKQGYFILTGSQNFLMYQAMSQQSLVGRVSLHTLLPLSVDELEASNLLPDQIEDVLYHGFYPATFTKKTPHSRLYQQYVRTYLERDIRELTHVGDLATFQTFLVLCAERVGQRINYTELGKECRISDQTARRWLTILEASYIIFQLQPYEKTISKQFIKTPKLFFYDTGLLCYLLQLEKKDLSLLSKKGNIFESFVISEIVKYFYNHGHEPTIYFWQDKYKHEVDCIIRYGSHLIATEIKSSRTPSPHFFDNLANWKNSLTPQENKPEGYVIYADTKDRITGYENLISWQSIGTILGFLDRK